LKADLILAWAAVESGWGTGSAAIKNNNYFGLTTNNWPFAVNCGSGSFAGFACFDTSQGFGLFQSAKSALTSGNGRYLNATLLAINSNGSDFDVMRSIAAAGFNSEAKDDGTTYANQVLSVLSSVLRAIKCMT